ncbi:ABC transporter permease [Vallitalea guaymasensis]|uniref:ABC transporter permease n=1 Tax=Vallitalea guaymasensis TaxID=1185412 RepID=A0A8J8SBE5_9FIRM|nr:ABC transporter permease [Vallitalea guaymasensis]QUH28330.1 ABC transporter permease [Vallitalea guaymasensis]
MEKIGFLKTKEGRKELFNKYGMVVILFIMIIVMTMIKPIFINTSNIINIFKQVAVIGTIAYGVTLIIITGGIDLSSGSVVALVGVVVASFSAPGDNIIIAIIIGLLVGALCGAINGIVLSYTGIPPFIATLGMMTIARGAALLYTNGRPISNIDESLLVLGTGKIGPVPIAVIIFLLAGLLTHIILRKSTFGKSIYAIGGNEQAAIVCGLNVKKIKILIYTFAGVMSAVGGIVLTARVSSGNPTAGLSYELDAIASAVIGGTSLSGGVGYISGTIIGALIIGVLNNGLTLIGVSPYWQQVVKGLIIVGAVILDAYKNKR